MFSAQLTHTFAAAHRLPNMGGKDANLHGHTWRTTVHVTGPDLNDGVLVAFGTYKKLMRDWIDTNLDHATLLGAADPLLPALCAENCRVLALDASAGHASSWPTVETVAHLIGQQATHWLFRLPTPGPITHPAMFPWRIARVDVATSSTHTVTWTDPLAGEPR